MSPRWKKTLWGRDADGNPVDLEDDYIAWIRQWDDVEGRRVAYDELPGVTVSTVFLATDHNWRDTGDPILWGTMVFGGELDSEQWRYTSEKDALVGHAKVVAMVKAKQ